ncbi:MAG TPA: short-chain dehydrogenase/reductase [Solirubrobacteraceae bacterium]|nr:short-chain dehydrogenase/reductase [Solirubrobacteraceae bacterium]
MSNLVLKGKVALVTGAAGGIGLASARGLSARGARVVLCDVQAAEVERQAQALGVDRALGLGVDVTDRAAMGRAVEATVERFGRLDVIFANAGIAPDPPTTIATIDESMFERVVEVDLLGVWRTVRAGLEQVVARRGHVLLTSSIYAFANGVINGAYAASKAGVEQLGRALRTELAADGASAGVLYPGWVDTAMVHASVDQHASVLRIHESLTPRPLAKRIPPETVAKAVVRGIERRAPRIFVPRIWTPLSVLRGGLNPLIDRALDRNTELHAVLRDVSSARTR